MPDANGLEELRWGAVPLRPASKVSNILSVLDNNSGSLKTWLRSIIVSTLANTLAT
jgi:hypothetical protein